MFELVLAACSCALALSIYCEFQEVSKGGWTLLVLMPAISLIGFLTLGFAPGMLILDRCGTDTRSRTPGVQGVLRSSLVPLAVGLAVALTEVLFEVRIEATFESHPGIQSSLMALAVLTLSAAGVRNVSVRIHAEFFATNA